MSISKAITNENIVHRVAYNFTTGQLTFRMGKIFAAWLRHENLTIHDRRHTGELEKDFDCEGYGDGSLQSCVVSGEPK